jgi:hypothetical protein
MNRVRSDSANFLAGICEHATEADIATKEISNINIHPIPPPLHPKHDDMMTVYYDYDDFRVFVGARGDSYDLEPIVTAPIVIVTSHYDRLATLQTRQRPVKRRCPESRQMRR